MVILNQVNGKRMIEGKTKRPWWRKWKSFFIRQYPRKRKLRGTFLHKILGNRLFDPLMWIPNRASVAKGIALGLFIGLLPFFGLQIFLTAVLCLVFRVNITAAILATFITNPVTAPGILLMQYKLGMWLSGPVNADEVAQFTGVLRYIVGHGKPLMVGCLSSALLASMVGYPMALWGWDIMTKVGKSLPHPRLPHLGKKTEEAAPGKWEEFQPQPNRKSLFPQVPSAVSSSSSQLKENPKD